MSGWSFIKKATNLTGLGVFKTISCPSGTSPVATSTTDVLTLLAGTGITITGDSTSDSVTIAATGGGGGSPGGSGTNLQYRLTASTFGGLPNSYVDATNAYLGLNVASPSVTLHVAGSQSTTPAPTSFSVSQVAELSNTASSVSTAVTYGPNPSDGVATVSATQSNGAYTYFADGSTSITYTVYAIRVFNSTYYYRGNAQQASFTDDNSSQNFKVDLSWTAVTGVDGYLITASGSANNGNPNWSLYVGNVTSYSDDGSLSGSDSPSTWDGFAYPYDAGGTAPTAPSGTPALNRTNVGSGNKGPASGLNWVYYIDTATTINGTIYCSGSPIGPFSAYDTNDGQFYDWDLSSWTLGGGSENDIIVKRSSDGGSTFEYFFMGGLYTSLTDGTYTDNATAASRWGQTYGGPPSTITRYYKAYGYGVSPTNSTQWFSASSNSYTVTANNDTNGYVIVHTVTQGSQNNSRILGDYYAIGDYSGHYDTSATVFHEGASNIWSAGATVTPTHYGIQATGQTRYWRLYAQKTSPSTYYSSSYLSGSSTLPNDSNYYTFNVSWTAGTGSSNTKILESTDGTNYTAGRLQGGTSFVREASTPSFSDGTTVTPNTIDGTAIIAQNSATTTTDSAQLILRTTATGSGVTNSTKLEFQDVSSSARGKIYNDTSAQMNYWTSASTHKFHNSSAGNFADIGLTGTYFNKTNQSSYIFQINTQGGDQGLKLNAGSNQPQVWIGSNSSFNTAALSIVNVSDFKNLYLKAASGQVSNLIEAVDSSSTAKFRVNYQGFVFVGNPSTTTGKVSIQGSDTSNPSLTLDSGTLTTSPVNGALEYDGNFYITNSGTRRRIAVAPVGGLTSGTFPIATTNGALIDSTITDNGSNINFARQGLFQQGLAISSNQNLTMGSGGQYLGGFRVAFTAFSGSVSLNLANHSPWSRYTGSGGHTATLPTAASIAGTYYGIKNMGTGNLTIATTSSQTIKKLDNTTPTSITLVPGAAFLVLSDGTNWQEII